MKKKWIYLGLFFDEDSKKELMRRIGDKIPEGWTPYMDHVTVAFNDDVAKQDEVFWDFKQNMLGKRYIVDIRSIGLSDRAMAGRVSNLKTNNAVSHVTIAVAPGAKPVESNDITDWYAIYPSSPIYLVGTFGYFANGQINFN